MTVAEILDAVRQYPAKHAVVTGGEPMIAPGIVELTESIREPGCTSRSRPRGQCFIRSRAT